VKQQTRLSSPIARFLLALYSVLLALTLLLTAPWWLRELRAGGKYREGWRERLGRIPRGRLQAPARGQTVVWVHAVSVGEVLGAAPLVQQLRAELPGAWVYLSTTTRTAQAVARSRFGADTVFYFPADFAFAVRAWCRFLHPSLVVLVESEFWPRFLAEAARRKIPVAVVNARVSPRSWPRYQRLRRLWRPLLATLALAQAQSADDATRLRALGASQVSVGGNLKYDLRPAPATELYRRLHAHLPPDVPVLVCGSTLAGEESLLVGALPPDAVVLLAPRHPERFGEVAALLAAQAQPAGALPPRPWIRLSSWRAAPQPIAPGTLLLLDSVGELAPIYGLATIAILGGGFLHAGGHNPLEAASVGRPVILGPGYENFAEIVSTLQDARAVVIAEPDRLAGAVSRLLADPEEVAAMGARAELVCRMRAGATRRGLDAILGLLHAGTSAP
jgi:3-deoxy-D-manno-octulosonic-acid transferase